MANEPHSGLLSGGRWQIQLLGGASVRLGLVERSRFNTKEVRLLLARLALEPRSSHGRDALAEWLWPQAGISLSTKLKRLRTALSELNKMLQPDGQPPLQPVVGEQRALRLNHALFECDAAAFEAAVRQGNHDLARTLYRGELLPGLDDADGWVADHRQRLGDLFLRLQSLPLSAAAAAANRPASRSALAPRGAKLAVRQLPHFVDRFIGREQDMFALAQTLQTHRLFTVLGPPGVGKTRLAVEVAALLDGFDAVFFVPLEACTNSQAVPAQMLVSMALQCEVTWVENALLAQLRTALHGQQVLLLLDSMEQVAGAECATLVSKLLQGMPGLHLLVTSRVALGVVGEHVHSLAPLPVPVRCKQGDQTPWPQALSANPAAALYLDRARRVRADFSLHARNAADVARLCELADGLPLMIELMAARVRELPPAKMVVEITRGGEPRAGRGRRAGRQGRHVSMDDAIGVSWRLLPPAQQRLLAALAVLPGGCHAEAAARVSGLDLQTLSQSLVALVGHSLVQDEDHGADAGRGRVDRRYTLLSSVRRFVQRHTAVDDAAALRRQRAVWALALAEELGRRHQPVAQADWPNFNVTLQDALDEPDLAAAMRLACALRWQWLVHGATNEILQALRALALAVEMPAGATNVDATTPGPDGASTLMALLARLMVRRGEAHPARYYATLALAHAGVDPAQRADALHAHVTTEFLLAGPAPQLLASARLAEQHAQASGQRDLQARTASLVGALSYALLGAKPKPLEIAAVAAKFDAAARNFQALGDDVGVLSTQPGRTACLLVQRKFAEVIGQTQAALAQAAPLRHIEVQLQLLNRQGLAYMGLRRYPSAVKVGQQQVALARQQGLGYHAALGLWNLPEALVRCGKLELAALTMAFIAEHWVTHYGALGADDQAHVDALRQRIEAKLGPAPTRTLWRDGERLTEAEGFALAQRLTFAGRG